MPEWWKRRTTKIGSATNGAPYARAMMYVVGANSQTSNSTSRTIRRNAPICGFTVMISGSTPSIGIDPSRIADVCGCSAIAIVRRTLSAIILSRIVKPGTSKAPACPGKEGLRRAWLSTGAQRNETHGQRTYRDRFAAVENAGQRLEPGCHNDNSCAMRCRAGPSVDIDRRVTARYRGKDRFPLG